MDAEHSNWEPLLVLLFLFLFFAYFGWKSKTSRFVWERAKTDPNYPGYRRVYRFRAFSIILGVILFGFIIGLLVMGNLK
jgi:hypothetical protein